MLSNTKEITPGSLVCEIAAMGPHGYRFVTLTCLDLGDKHEILYHFDKNYELCNLRLELPKGTPLPSISHVYFAAVLVENELKDLFAIDVQGMAIDFQGRLLLAEGQPAGPMNKTVVAVADATKPVVAGGAK